MEPGTVGAHYVLALHRWMDRQRRAASKVTDYRKYHLSGDLNEVIQGKVSETIHRLESSTIMDSTTVKESATADQLQDMLKEQKANSSRLQQQVKEMQLRNDLEVERLQQEQWNLAIERLKQAREQVMQQHEENMEKIRNIPTDTPKGPSNPAATWLEEQLYRKQTNGAGGGNPDKLLEEAAQKKRMLEQLQQQQEEIRRQQEEVQKEMEGILSGESNTNPSITDIIRQTVGSRSSTKPE